MNYYDQEVTGVAVLGGYRLKVAFADGFAAEIDLSPLVGRGDIYERLRDEKFFQRVRVAPELGVLEWADDLELSPGSLRAWCEAGRVMSHEETDIWMERHSAAPHKAA